jgi:plastocyanin
MNPRRREVAHTVAVAGVAAALLAGFAWQALGAAPPLISQRDRQFQPGRIEIAVGETVHIVNDDGELIHHAYIESPTFDFDSGEQEPGAHVDIRFTRAGLFTVRCGIHPKMHLFVTVK